ncbi:MAG: hypothetical protein GY874_01510 [Desulfobacteraceae bacterium]|nr:hypothetical protein [Desulfobacteraceae bacterium]
MAWQPEGYAAYLNNVKIGKHKIHTRIVLEFDEPISSHTVNDKLSNQLAIELPGVVPDLKRKIPVYLNQNITDIHFGVFSGRLSARIFFNFDKYELDYFKLNNPFRLVIDVRPVNVKEGLSQQNEDITLSKQSKTIATAAQTPPSIETVNIPEFKKKSKTDILQFEHADQPLALQHGIDHSKNMTASNHKYQYSQYKYSQLQYYLIVSLIAITIMILLLLFFLILSKKL